MKDFIQEIKKSSVDAFPMELYIHFLILLICILHIPLLLFALPS